MQALDQERLDLREELCNVEKQSRLATTVPAPQTSTNFFFGLDLSDSESDLVNYSFHLTVVPIAATVDSRSLLVDYFVPHFGDKASSSNKMNSTDGFIEICWWPPSESSIEGLLNFIAICSFWLFTCCCSLILETVSLQCVFDLPFFHILCVIVSQQEPCVSIGR